MVIIIIGQYYIAINRPAMHLAPATARAPRVCTLVPFIIIADLCFNHHSIMSIRENMDASQGGMTSFRSCVIIT